jgi:glycosyltransferase involved in cell wall biosynthesis
VIVNVRILLFDWIVAGHREVYLRYLVHALSPAEVVLAVPDDLADRVSDLGVETIRLGAARPAINERRHLSRAKRTLGREETRLFSDSIDAACPDHAIHLHADPIARWLASGPVSKVPISLLLFRPRAHYPSVYGSPLSAREQVAAYAFEFIVHRWRGRPDAHAVLTLDEGAARRWQQARGAPAYWLPEPPVLSQPGRSNHRAGCIVFGALAARKGIGLLAQAVTLAPTDVRVVLAGVADPSYRAELGQQATAMREAGASVEVRDWWHTEQAKLEILAAARCAVVPYPRHYGMSRILVEAASVGTPVVAHRFGLVGHLVERHGIGLAVDCGDPGALRAALLTMTEDGTVARAYAASLREFAAGYSAESFRAVLSRVFLSEEA